MDRKGAPKKIPVGRIGRMARLAMLGTKTGASFVVSKTGQSAAENAAEVLGSLRGLAAKVGQMASYVDGMVPEEHRPAYEAALSSLRAAAPTSSPEQIQSLVEDELGAPIDRLFAEWDREPFASASIGQVHRARLEDGREVAVKVQHPGIDRAVESDLQNAGMLRAIVASIGPKSLETKRVFDEIKARFREELDYRHEAEQQRFFIGVHADDPKITIPAVIAERSSRRVLTSELVFGSSLEDAARESESDRHDWARTLWRFVFRGNLVNGRFNADPHPGNYLFNPDGHVSFIDFGCIQPIGKHHQASARDAHRAAIRRDEPAFERAVADMLGTRPGVYQEAAIAYSRRCFEPLFSSPYRLERGYVASLVEDAGKMKRHMLDRKSGFVQMPPGMVLLNRLQFGFYSVLARLDVAVDYAAVEAEFLSKAGLWV